MGLSITKNLLFNLLLQISTLVLPLITIPYISRILGAEGIGTYSYTLSITQYFIVVGTLGLTMYGNRQIAYTRDDKEKMSRAFWSILLLRVMTTGFATIIYFFVFWNTKVFRDVYMIQSINIIAAMLDISWLYMGLEDFKKTVTRNLLVKIIGVSLIFTFVKSKNDLYLYVLINAFMSLIGNLVMWMYLPRAIVRIKLEIRDLTTHIIPTIQLFIPQIAIQVYVVLDKTMIGVLAGVGEVGYFDQSEKIVKAVLGLVTALGIVMLPRMSNIFANGDKEKLNSYLNKSLQGVSYVAVPMAIGIASISNEFVPWFFGPGFEPVSYLMIALSPILFFIAMSNVLGTQYLLPSDRTKEFTTSVTIGALVNVILNLILIPRLKSLGACIATVVAEFLVTAVQYYYLRREIDIKSFLNGLLKYVLAAVVMFVVVRVIGTIFGARLVILVLQCLIGIIVYLVILTVLREKITTKIFATVFSKIIYNRDLLSKKVGTIFKIGIGK